MGPRVSVIVVAYRDARLLRECLGSLARTGGDGLPLEVLVVVNGAQIRWAAGLPELEGRVRYLTAGANLGFAGACNLAARQASGEYLALLNDDATVEPGWLASLVRTAERHPEAGAVGGCVLDGEGRIHEAGSVVWSDGRTLGVGRGLPADSSRWDFVRRVDYCSASSLLVRRDAWDRVEGMDAGFHPAYSEDVDLCLRLAETGLGVYYEPRSRIVHRVSQSTDATYRDFLHERGRRRLVSRWGDLLAGREAAPQGVLLAGAVERAADRARGQAPRVLLVDDRLPDRSRGSGFGRMLDIVEELGTSGCVLSVHPTCEVTGDRDALRDLGCRVVDTDLEQHLAEPGLAYDVVVVSRPVNVARVVGAVRLHQPRAHVIYDAEALWHRRLERQAALTSDAPARRAGEDEAARMHALEEAAVRMVDSVVCISGEEADVVASMPGHAPVSVIEPLPQVIRPTTSSFERRSDIVFVAGWLAGPGSPNEDALAWFADSVLPLVRQRLPWARLLVTGAAPPLAVRVRRSAAIRLVGHVSDLWAFYDAARVAVSPMRFGSGVKIKTVEALLHGVPVVATGVGAEGVDCGDIPVLEPRDDPGTMAEELVELLSSPAAWQRRRELVERLLERWQARGVRGRWPAVVAAAARTAATGRGATAAQAR